MSTLLRIDIYSKDDADDLTAFGVDVQRNTDALRGYAGVRYIAYVPKTKMRELVKAGAVEATPDGVREIS